MQVMPDIWKCFCRAIDIQYNQLVAQTVNMKLFEAQLTAFLPTTQLQNTWTQLQDQAYNQLLAVQISQMMHSGVYTQIKQLKLFCFQKK